MKYLEYAAIAILMAKWRCLVRQPPGTQEMDWMLGGALDGKLSMKSFSKTGFASQRSLVLSILRAS